MNNVERWELEKNAIPLSSVDDFRQWYDNADNQRAMDAADFVFLILQAAPHIGPALIYGDILMKKVAAGTESIDNRPELGFMITADPDNPAEYRDVISCLLAGLMEYKGSYCWGGERHVNEKQN